MPQQLITGFYFSTLQPKTITVQLRKLHQTKRFFPSSKGGPDKTRQDMTRQDMTWHDKTSKTRQARQAGQDKTKQARQDKQDKFRQDKTSKMRQARQHKQARQDKQDKTRGNGPWCHQSDHALSAQFWTCWGSWGRCWIPEPPCCPQIAPPSLAACKKEKHR